MLKQISSKFVTSLSYFSFKRSVPGAEGRPAPRHLEAGHQLLQPREGLARCLAHSDGLTLIHFSDQCEHFLRFLCDTLGILLIKVTKHAQVELRSGRVEARGGIARRPAHGNGDEDADDQLDEQCRGIIRHVAVVIIAVAAAAAGRQGLSLVHFPV